MALALLFRPLLQCCTDPPTDCLILPLWWEIPQTTPQTLQAGISTTLHNLLATSPLFTATGASPGNVLRSADQLGELVTLTAQLLPPIPDAAAAMVQDVPPSPYRAIGALRLRYVQGAAGRSM